VVRIKFVQDGSQFEALAERTRGRAFAAARQTDSNPPEGRTDFSPFDKFSVTPPPSEMYSTILSPMFSLPMFRLSTIPPSLFLLSTIRL